MYLLYNYMRNKQYNYVSCQMSVYVYYPKDAIFRKIQNKILTFFDQPPHTKSDAQLCTEVFQNIVRYLWNKIKQF